MAPAASCAPGIRKLRLECTWSPFWNLFVSPRRGGRGEVGRGEGESRRDWRSAVVVNASDAGPRASQVIRGRPTTFGFTHFTVFHL